MVFISQGFSGPLPHTSVTKGPYRRMHVTFLVWKEGRKLGLINTFDIPYFKYTLKSIYILWALGFILREYRAVI
jgi:hypothetical protein